MGKSSVTLQLALALSLQGKSVGILDIDLTGPSVPRLVGLEKAKITQAPGGWLPVTVHDAQDDTVTTTQEQTEGERTGEGTKGEGQGKKGRGSLRCMSLGFLLRERGDAVIWRGPKKTAMIRQFLSDVHWGPTDYLLVDTPPGTSDEHIALAEQLLTLSTTDAAAAAASNYALPRLAGAVLVTTPQAIATSDVRKEVNFCSKTKIPPLGVIENMSGYACPCCGEVSNLFSSGGGQVMAEEMGVKFLGIVPVDVKFGVLIEGDTIDVSDSEDEDGRDRSQRAEEKEREKKAAEERAQADDRPLVEKYQEGCWSYSRFEEFVKTIISRVESTG